MSHLRRAIGALIALLIIVFFVPRILPTSSALESYGFYPNRNADSTITWASQPVQYVDTAQCATCHRDNQATWSRASHSGVSCETCHGPAAAHIKTGASLPKDGGRESCGVCHSQVTARPASFPQIDLNKHNEQASCTACHNPHDPLSKAKPAATGTPSTASPAASAAPVTSSIPAIPHSLEGRADCLACHNTGSIKPFPADHNGRANATCQSCHRSK